MVRPSKDIRIKRNGDYLQVVYDGIITSLSPELLCQLAKTKRRVGTKKVMAQLTLINNEGET